MCWNPLPARCLLRNRLLGSVCGQDRDIPLFLRQGSPSLATRQSLVLATGSRSPPPLARRGPTSVEAVWTMSLFPLQDNEQSAAVRKRCDTAVDNRMYEARSDDVRTFPPPNSLLLNVQTVPVTDFGLFFRQFLLFRRQQTNRLAAAAAAARLKPESQTPLPTWSTRSS